jgi:hypothetical protein
MLLSSFRLNGVAWDRTAVSSPHRPDFDASDIATSGISHR